MANLFEELGEDVGGEVDKKKEEAERDGGILEKHHTLFLLAGEGGVAMAMKAVDWLTGSLQAKHREKGWGTTSIMHL